MTEIRRQLAATAALLFLHFSLALVGQTRAPVADTDGPRDPEETLQLQIRLDRAGFSPGEIDGRDGANTDRAVRAYLASVGSDAGTGRSEVLASLAHGDAPVMTTHIITADEADGPFTPEIPDELMEQADLTALEYRDVVEALAERFHLAPALLRELNPGSDFSAGASIQVPNVKPHPPLADAGDSARAPRGVEVTVSKSASTLTVRSTETGDVMMHAPATTGSAHDPLPIGDWTVTGVSPNPVFHYNPDLFWDADAGDSKATIPAGPNGPVGIVWIDLSKEHYGIHGTAEPSTIGHTASHGCVRLTNWDAARLAALVGPGTPVRFVE